MDKLSKYKHYFGELMPAECTRSTSTIFWVGLVLGEEKFIR